MKMEGRPPQGYYNCQEIAAIPDGRRVRVLRDPVMRSQVGDRVVW